MKLCDAWEGLSLTHATKIHHCRSKFYMDFFFANVTDISNK